MTELSGISKSSARINSILWSIFAAVIVAVGYTCLHDPSQTSMVKRGDFPGFYAPAVIIAEGKGRALYDVELQRKIENEFWPSFEGRELVSVYPAFVAVLSQPLAALPPLAAKALMALYCCIGILLFVAASSYRLRPRIPARTAFMIITIFPPMLISILGGQNTGITLGLIGIIVWALDARAPHSDYIVGLALAAMLYKPQIGLPVAALFVVWREWKVVCTFLLGMLALYAVAVPWTGIAWGREWFAAGLAFSGENYRVNGARMISPLAGLRCLWPNSSFSLLAGVGITAVAYAETLRRSAKAIHRRRAFLYLCATVAILSPQSLFYELGLVLPAVLLLTISTERPGKGEYVRACILSACSLAAFLALDWSRVPWFSGIGALSLLLLFQETNGSGRRERSPTTQR